MNALEAAGAVVVVFMGIGLFWTLLGAAFERIRGPLSRATAEGPLRSASYYVLMTVVFFAGAGLFLVCLFAVIANGRALVALVALLGALKALHKLNGDSWDGVFVSARATKEEHPR